MALGRVWRVCSVWLLLTVTLTLGCERLQLLQALNKETLGKLDEMGGRLLRQCVTERLSLKTKPLDLVKLSAEAHAHDWIWIVHQTLHHLRRIYSHVGPELSGTLQASLGSAAQGAGRLCPETRLRDQTKEECCNS